MAMFESEQELMLGRASGGAITEGSRRGLRAGLDR